MSDNNMNQMPDGMNPNGADGPQPSQNQRVMRVSSIAQTSSMQDSMVSSSTEQTSSTQRISSMQDSTASSSMQDSMASSSTMQISSLQINTVSR